MPFIRTLRKFNQRIITSRFSQRVLTTVNLDILNQNKLKEVSCKMKAWYPFGSVALHSESLNKFQFENLNLKTCEQARNPVVLVQNL